MKERVSYLEVFNLFKSFNFLTFEGSRPQGHFNVNGTPYAIFILYAGGGKDMENASVTGLRIMECKIDEGFVWLYVEFDELLGSLPESAQTQLLFHLDLFRRFL